MTVKLLHHFDIVTPRLRESADWYVNAIGLKEGYRPPLPFEGVWLYVGEISAVHLASENPTADITDEDPHADRSGSTGPLDHIAFEASGLKPFLANLEARSIEFKHKYVEQVDLHQVFLRDPNGIVIEINFPSGSHD